MSAKSYINNYQRKTEKVSKRIFALLVFSIALLNLPLHAQIAEYATSGGSANIDTATYMDSHVVATSFFFSTSLVKYFSASVHVTTELRIAFRLLLLKLHKQIGGTIYRFFLTMNQAQVGGAGGVQLDANLHPQMAIWLSVQF